MARNQLFCGRVRIPLWIALAASWIAYLDAAQIVQPSGTTSQRIFRAGIDVVQLDVLVLDESRRPVRGLTSADFTVLENGKPQPIVGFAAIDVPDLEEPTAAWMRDVAPDVVSNEIETRRLVAIVIDDANMRFDPGVAKFAKLVGQSAINQLGPNDLAAVVFTFLGRQQNFTSDRAKLVAAIDSLVPHPGSVGCSLHRGGCDIATLTRVGSVLRNAPAGRKAVIFITGGRCFTPRKGGGGCTGDVFEMATEVQEMFRTLQEANVTVYAFDANGLQTHQATAADRRPIVGPSLSLNDSLHLFADATGGRAFGGNVPWQYISEVFRENSSYYLIGFQPTTPLRDGRFRKLDVTVNRPDVKVRTRSGYFAAKPETRTSSKLPPPSDLEVAIARGMPSGQVPLQASVVSVAVPDRRDGETTVVVRIRQLVTDGSTPFSVGTPSPRQASVKAAVFDTNWKIVASAEHTLASILKPDEHGSADYEVVFRFRLRPGRYEARFAATHGEQTGSVFLDIDVPHFQREVLSLSDVAVERTPALPLAFSQPIGNLIPITPTTVRDFLRTDRGTVFMRIYQGASQRPEPVKVESRIVNRFNEPVFDKATLIGADEFVRNRSADYQLDLPVTQLPSGEYMLTLKTSAGQRSAIRNLRFTVR